MRTNSWNKEKHLPNLLHIRDTKRLTVTINNKKIYTDNRLISQMENNTKFDL